MKSAGTRVLRFGIPRAISPVAMQNFIDANLIRYIEIGDLSKLLRGIPQTTTWQPFSFGQLY